MTRDLPNGRGHLTIVTDGEALARAAAARVVEATRTAVDERGIALIALSGGSTPKRMGELLASPDFSPFVPWDRTEIFWGDERWVPIDHGDSNAGAALRGWLAAVGSPTRIHPVDTQTASPEAGAAAYEATIRSVAKTPLAVPVFDLILLGMGDDGHTASLFPDTAALNRDDALVVANHVPKLQADRITFTYPLINAARDVVFLIVGAGKRETLHGVIDGPEQRQHFPSQGVRPTAGKLTWLVDEAAAQDLNETE